MSRRILALVIAVMLCLSACAFASADGASVYPLATDTTLTVWMPFDSDIGLYGYSSQNETPGFKAWQEATGIKVEVVEPADNTALNLLLASGDLPDMIRANKEFYTGGLTAMVNDGVAIDLTDKLPEFAPNYWEFINSDPAIYSSAALNIDGDLRVVSFSGNFYPATSPFRSYAGMIIRKDFMEKLGITEIKTNDDFANYLRRCKNELGVETPLMSEAWLNDYMWKYGYFTSAYGLPCAYDYQIDGTFHFGAYEEGFKGYLEYMNGLYTEGLFDPNFTVTNGDTAYAAMSSGKSAAMAAMTSHFMNVTSATQDPELKLTALSPLTGSAEDDKAMMSFAANLTSKGFWCFVTEACQDVEAALRFFDYLYTPEGKDLANYGIEGETYTRDADGNVVLTEFVTNNPNGLGIDPILRSFGLVNWSCIHRAEFSAKRFPMPEQSEACTLWSNSHYADYMIANYAVPADMQEEYTKIKTDIDTYLKESIANFITGTESLDNFDNYLATMKTLGVERYIEIMQAAIDPFYAK